MENEKQRKANFLERLKFYTKEGLTPTQKKELIDFVEYKVWQNHLEKWQHVKENFDSLRNGN